MNNSLEAIKSSDDLLQPSLENDGLVQYMACVYRESESNNNDDEDDWSDDDVVVPTQATEADILRSRIADLEEMAQKMSTTLRSAIDQDLITANATVTTPTTTSITSTDMPKDDIKKNDAAYFGGYSDRLIHEVMLRDTHRTETYRDSMLARPDLFKDKVVLDVGCGTGILSMFAARAGARRVVGVDAASIIDRTRDIVERNGLSDKITLVKGKVEEIVLPADVLSVDIIVSEWMGYFLLYETMLPSVFYARDKWMRRCNGISVYEDCMQNNRQYTTEEAQKAKKSAQTTLPFARDALLFPDVARMFVSGIETNAVRERTHNFWHDVYGFDMSLLISSEESAPIATVEVVKQRDACTITSKEGLISYELMSCQSEELDFVSNFTLTSEKDDIIDTIVVWFDTVFSSLERRNKFEGVDLTTPANDSTPVDMKTIKNTTEKDFSETNDGSLVLDTTYTRDETHWRQTLFRLPYVIKVNKGDTIDFTLDAKRRSDNHRHYDVYLTYQSSSACPAPEGSSPIMSTNWAEAGVKYTHKYSLQ